MFGDQDRAMCTWQKQKPTLKKPTKKQQKNPKQSKTPNQMNPQNLFVMETTLNNIQTPSLQKHKLMYNHSKWLLFASLKTSTVSVKPALGTAHLILRKINPFLILKAHNESWTLMEKAVTAVVY